ncbi:hypothetical protein ACTQ49_06185 [Luteococcus sp. Sow4_B9]|uniref:hypothetical protein n=1 Tax=Luteococcus sp. Sow4_B9 TaxID=3438792 RepID=UPI003F979BE4
MTDAPDPRTYVLKPRPPVRAFVIAAGMTLLGALLVSLATAKEAALLWVVLAAIILIAGLVLAAMAGWSMVTMRTFVDLDPKGYRIHGPGTDKSGTWGDVTKVTTSAQGSHLTLYHGEVGRTHLICPGGGEDEEMKALVAAVAQHLDADRGYGETINVPLIDPHQPPNPDVVSHKQ